MKRLSIGDMLRRRNVDPPAPRHFSELIFTVGEIRERESGLQYLLQSGHLMAIVDDDQLDGWQRVVIVDKEDEP
ncbi:MAG: hypothetical protein EBS91_08110 [Betaproteobacteria bacterium]|jgi:hypothetical protein|nr:hypothetical protein [Betaproteobacteria bacterium]NCA24545.1 hypothetical protein [Betaproteobacteria bacterium]